MLSFDANQLALVAADNKIVRWVYTVYDNAGVEQSNLIITDFSGIELRRNMAENTIIAPSEISFTISNANNTLDFNDFRGGSVLIELYLSNATLVERKIAGWKFRIKTAHPGYQNIKIVAEDFLQHYLRGSYPNTQLPQAVFPSSRSYSNDALCVPVPFGTAYIPLRDVYITDAGYIMLGDPALTYTITKIRSPRELGVKCEWASAGYTFTQSTKADANAVDWRVFQAIIADVNNDGAADAPGFWFSGENILDPPVQFTRSDTASMTDFADVISFVLQDFGVPVAMIDVAGTFAAAKTIYTGWGLACNGAFWYKQPREKVLATLLTMCHSCLDVGETIKLRVLAKASKATITAADIMRTAEQGEGTFSYQNIVNNDLSDAGYVAYQETNESQDSFIKVLVPAGVAATVVSEETIECPFVQDSQIVQKIGILHFQRRLLREAEVGFLSKGTRLALQPDDVITINANNYGGSYAVLVDSIKINKDISIQFQCSKFTIAFSDWGDLSPTAITVPADDTINSWQPSVTGPDSPGASPLPNALNGRLLIGNSTSYILLDPTATVPRISMYPAGAEKARLGNLNGYLGVVTDLFGFGIGSSAGTGANLIYDVTNGLRLRSGLTNVVSIDNAGNIIISGGISASTIDIGGDDATSFHVDIDGNMWMGASVANKATAPLRISSAGALVGISVTLTGAINATSGKFGTATNYWSVGATGLTAISASTDVIINYGKTDFDNTQNGFILGYDFSAAKAKVYIGDSTSYLNWDGTALTYTKGTLVETIIQMYTSVASLATSATAGDGSASSAGIKVTYEGFFGCGANQTATVAAANANVRILATGAAFFSGTVTATAGEVGGFHIDANSIHDAADTFGLASAVAGVGDVRFWAGDTYENRATAPFRVTKEGLLYFKSSDGTNTTSLGFYSGVSSGAVFRCLSGVTAAMTWVTGTTWSAHVEVTQNPLVYYGLRLSQADAKVSFNSFASGAETTHAFINTLTGASYFAGTMGVGVETPVGSFVHIKKDQNAPTILKVENTTSGTAAAALVGCYGDGGAFLGIGRLNTSYTTSGLEVADSVIIQAGGNTAGLRIFTADAYDVILGTNNAANIIIKSGGNIAVASSGTPLGKLCIDGGVTVGSMVDAGDNNLRVEGTATVIGNAVMNGSLGIGTASANKQLAIWGANSSAAQMSLGWDASYNWQIGRDNASDGRLMFIECYNGASNEYMSIAHGGTATIYAVYITGNCSALSFTDRTPGYEGDALAAIEKIKNKYGNLDHATLPKFAQKKIIVHHEEGGENVVEDGRDLGAMISIHTVALQQLLQRIVDLEARSAPETSSNMR